MYRRTDLLWIERIHRVFYSPNYYGVDPGCTCVDSSPRRRGFRRWLLLVPAARLLLIERLVDGVHAIYGQGEPAFNSALVWLVALVSLQMGQALLGAIRAHAQALVRERTAWRLEEMVIGRASRAALSQFEHAEFFDRMQRAQWAAIWRSFSIFSTALGAAGQSR